jgi:Tol biopolymer transport system component
MTDARFTPSGDKIVVLYGGDLYSYDLHLKRATRLTQSGLIGSINIASDGRLFYNKNGTFVIADSEARNPQVIFAGGEHGIYRGDLSPDGNKVLYRKTLDSGYQWSNSVLAYYDIQAKKERVIPNVMNNCGASPKWAPNGYHLLVHESACSRGWPGATLRITDLNGSFLEYIVQASNDFPDNFMFSPDGNSVLFTFDNYNMGSAIKSRGAIDSMGGPANFYIMSLAKPVPEFGSSVVLTVAAVSMIGLALAIQRFWRVDAEQKTWEKSEQA